MFVKNRPRPGPTYMTPAVQEGFSHNYVDGTIEFCQSVKLTEERLDSTLLQWVSKQANLFAGGVL